MQPLLLGDLGSAFVLGCVAGELTVSEALEQCRCGFAGVTMDTDRDWLHETEHLVVGIDLDDLGVLWPVVHVVLRQRAEWAEPGAEGDHDVSLVDQAHRGL